MMYQVVKKKHSCYKFPSGFRNLLFKPLAKPLDVFWPTTTDTWRFAELPNRPLPRWCRPWKRFAATRPAASKPGQPGCDEFFIGHVEHQKISKNMGKKKKK